MADKNVLQESQRGPEIYESLDESLRGPEIWESSNGEESGRSDCENEIQQNPHDVIFLVGDEEPRKFILNRFVCEISSPELQRVLREPPKAGNYYEIRNVAPDDFQTLVDHMFLKSSWTFTTLSTALCLVEIAGKLQLFAFQEEIFAKLRQIANSDREILSDDSVFKAFSIFKDFDLRDGRMKRTAKEYIFENAAHLFEQDGFLELSALNFAEFLEDENLAVESELQVFKAVIRWGVHVLQSGSNIFTLENLKDIISPLTDLIRFENMSPLEIRQYVLPLNVLHGRAAGNLKKKSSQGRKPRNYVEQECYDDKMQKLFSVALQSAEAKHFISSFKMEMQFYNERLENQILHAEQVKTIQKLENEVVQLKQQLEKQKSHAENLEEDLKSNKKFWLEMDTKQSKLKTDVFDILSSSDGQLLRRATRFPNTKEYAVALLFENSTSTTLQLQENYKHNSEMVEYEKVAAEIHVNQTELFGWTRECHYAGGFLSYQIDDVFFIISYINYSGGYIVAIALCPTGIGSGLKLFAKLLNPDFLSGRADCCYHREHIKSLVADQELNVAVKLGKLKATAIMKTGKKSLIKVRLSEI